MFFDMNQLVEIVNHSEPKCNGQYGTIIKIETGYDGQTQFYTVELEDSGELCLCTSDEIMEA